MAFARARAARMRRQNSPDGSLGPDRTAATGWGGPLPICYWFVGLRNRAGNPSLALSLRMRNRGCPKTFVSTSHTSATQSSAGAARPSRARRSAMVRKLDQQSFDFMQRKRLNRKPSEKRTATGEPEHLEKGQPENTVPIFFDARRGVAAPTPRTPRMPGSRPAKVQIGLDEPAGRRVFGVSPQMPLFLARRAKCPRTVAGSAARVSCNTELTIRVYARPSRATAATAPRG